MEIRLLKRLFYTVLRINSINTTLSNQLQQLITLALYGIVYLELYIYFESSIWKVEQNCMFHKKN